MDPYQKHVRCWAREVLGGQCGEVAHDLDFVYRAILEAMCLLYYAAPGYIDMDPIKEVADLMTTLLLYLQIEDRRPGDCWTDKLVFKEAEVSKPFLVSDSASLKQNLQNHGSRRSQKVLREGFSALKKWWFVLDHCDNKSLGPIHALLLDALFIADDLVRRLETAAPVVFPFPESDDEE